MSRNNVVRNILQQAIERMEMVSDKLELWIVLKLAPEAANLKIFVPASDEKAIQVDLGPLTRNTRTVLNEDHLVVIHADDVVGKIPYDGIYCVATSGSLASTLEWSRHTNSEEDVAYVNLVSPEHDMPEHLLLPQR